MQTALLILSPLDTAPLHAQPAADLAIFLKNQGVARVDLTADSHYSAPQAHGGYAVGAFTDVARNMAWLMNSVVGATRMYDLPAAFDRAQSPSAASLLNVAHNCLRHVAGPRDGAPDRRDVRSLAIVFYAAIHSGRYDKLVFPHLSSRAQTALFVLGNNLRGLDTGQPYGRPIHLDTMRNKIFDLCGIRAAPANTPLN